MPAIIAVRLRDRLDRPDCRIEPHVLPAYAQHFNAIERLSGVMHREVADNTFYRSFARFTAAIDNDFTARLPKAWPIWRDTVSDTFRILSHRIFRFLE